MKNTKNKLLVLSLICFSYVLVFAQEVDDAPIDENAPPTSDDDVPLDGHLFWLFLGMTVVMAIYSYQKRKLNQIN